MNEVATLYTEIKALVENQKRWDQDLATPQWAPVLAAIDKTSGVSREGVFGSIS
jgi:hypothetical protein